VSFEGQIPDGVVIAETWGIGWIALGVMELSYPVDHPVYVTPSVERQAMQVGAVGIDPVSRAVGLKDCQREGFGTQSFGIDSDGAKSQASQGEACQSGDSCRGSPSQAPG
jgi:hypothetical protein